MCGIVGLYDIKNSADLLPIASRMTGAIRHRGPDSEGIWQDPEHPNLVLGHRRLAILDLSPLGAQPMASASGRYLCAYNGEIYNYQAIESELKSLGHTFRGRSDTEIFLGALDQWGLNLTCQKIIGMYAFLIWDRKEKTLHLIRDRIGKKPLYVGWAGDCLIAGSELKSFHVHPDFPAEICEEALSNYMAQGFISAPRSIFKNVWSVPPGCRMTLPTPFLTAGEDLSRRLEKYWDFGRMVAAGKDHPSSKDENEILQDFEALLEICVKDRMVSDVPLGAFLSGGIDSGVVVSLMQKHSSRPVKTYTIGFGATPEDESSAASAMARHLGTDHHELFVGDRDALDVVPLLPGMYDEPFADISQIPTYLVSRFARHEVTVALSGDGGDELLGGYRRHFLLAKLAPFLRPVPPPLRRLGMRGIAEMTSNADLRHLAHALSQKTQEGTYAALLSSGAETLLAREKAPLVVGDLPAGLSLPEQIMAFDAQIYLPGDVLVKVDRASMAASLEARAPLLDKRLIEYAWSLPPNVKIRAGQGKWLLRKILARHVPPSLIGSAKKGFSPPVDSWLRGALKSWAEDLLFSSRMRQDGYFAPEAIAQMWEAHQSGKIQAGRPLWTVLMAQAWLDRWKGSSAQR